jgi:membrane glycosyltransferase
MEKKRNFAVVITITVGSVIVWVAQAFVQAMVGFFTIVWLKNVYKWCRRKHRTGIDKE